MTTIEAALLGPQGHDHPLGCRHLHSLEDAPQRDRGHHLGGSSSVRRCSRRGLACSSSSSSSDESFCTSLEHAWSVMNLCSFMRLGELLAQQPVLSGAVVFGVCVCCCVSTRVVQTCAVTLRGSVGSTRRMIHPNITMYTPGRVHTKQDDLRAKQLVVFPSGVFDRATRECFCGGSSEPRLCMCISHTHRQTHTQHLVSPPCEHGNELTY